MDSIPSDTDGIIDIEIRSNQIGDGQAGSQADFSIVKVAGQQLTEPVTFTCEVINQETGKYWNTYTYGKLGLSFFKVSGKKGNSLSLIENDPTNPLAESFRIKRQMQGKAGQLLQRS